MKSFLTFFLCGCIVTQTLLAQSLYSGDKVAIKSRGATPKYLMYYNNGGAVRLSPNKMSDSHAQLGTTFTIEKIGGKGGKIAPNDKIYIKAGNTYLSSYDSNGALSTKNTFSENPAISDEIFTIRFKGGNTTSPIAEFITRRNLHIGIENSKPTTLPIDNRSDDGADVLLMARLDNFSIEILQSIASQNTSNQNNRGSINSPASTEADQTINNKYQAIGWNRDGHTEIRTPAQRTLGGSGFVKYYKFNGRQTAIYYFPNRGAFAMDTAEMTAYDAAGQDNFAYVVSDPKSCGAGCGYNDMIMAHDNSEAVNVMGKFVYGAIYQKYKELNRWNGPLGIPTTSEGSGTNSLPEKGRFSHFQNGVIAFTGFTGAQALWGKTFTMWQKNRLGARLARFSYTSCNPNSNSQVVVFERGSIDVGNGCDSYNNKGYYTDVSGKVVGGKPCY